MKATPRQWAVLTFLILLWAGLLLARWGRSAPPVPPAERPTSTRVEARAATAPAAQPLTQHGGKIEAFERIGQRLCVVRRHQ